MSGQSDGERGCYAQGQFIDFVAGKFYRLDLLARQDSAEDFCRLKSRRCTAMDWIFIVAYCFAIS